VQQAFQKRWDLQAAASQVRAAEIVVSAARAERLPSASLTADYGVLGPSPTNHGVYSVTGAINVPVYQGGRVKADVEQAEATLHQRQAELADQRGRVEQDVRTALIELETAIGEVGWPRTIAASPMKPCARRAIDLTPASPPRWKWSRRRNKSPAPKAITFPGYSLSTWPASLVPRHGPEAETDLPTLLSGARP
jgi:hypothetical protein